MGSNATPEVARKALAAFGEALQVDLKNEFIID